MSMKSSPAGPRAVTWFSPIVDRAEKRLRKWQLAALFVTKFWKSHKKQCARLEAVFKRLTKEALPPLPGSNSAEHRKKARYFTEKLFPASRVQGFNWELSQLHHQYEAIRKTALRNDCGLLYEANFRYAQALKFKERIELLKTKLGELRVTLKAQRDGILCGGEDSVELVKLNGKLNAIAKVLNESVGNLDDAETVIGEE
jgi:hypothetical protein